MAMHPWEKQILDRWDAGSSIEMIAVELDRPVDQVGAVVGRYAAREHGLSAFDFMVTRGSAMLAERTKRLGRWP